MVSILLIFSICLTTLGCGEQKQRYEASFLQLFDTVTTIVSVHYNREDFTRLAEFIRDDLEKYNNLYDIYNDYEGINNIKTINDNAGKQPVKVAQEIIDLLQYGRELYEISGGGCNIAMGSVLRIWHKYREAGINDPETAALPPMEDLKEAALHTDINKMIIDQEASTVYLADPQMSLDVGAIAKGYATERVCQTLIKEGYQSVLLSVGGNVRAIGYKEPDLLWNVSIKNPDKTSEQKELLTTAIHDMTVTTSGVYERYYTVDGKQYHHIIDPETLMPSTRYQSVTILAKDSKVADGLTTAIFNMSIEEGMRLIDSLPYAEALWVLPDGTIKESVGFRQYIKK